MKVIIHDDQKKYILDGIPGTNLAQFLTRHGFLSGIICGRGICGKCAVKIISGKVDNINQKSGCSELAGENYILACMSSLSECDLELELLHKNQKFVFRKTSILNFDSQMEINDKNINKIFIPFNTKNIPEILDCHNNEETKIFTQFLKDQDTAGATAVVSGKKLLAMESGDTTEDNYGFVIDLGTSTIACYLLDLARGKTVEAQGFLNPQALYGADVITRIEHALKADTLEIMHRLTVDKINDVLKKLLIENNIPPQNVYSMVVVGNTAMSRIFLNKKVTDLASAPFVITDRKRIKRSNMAFHFPMLPEAEINVLANISAYVGSDALAMIMACKPWENRQWNLLIDIGTNGEIILAKDHKFYACSAAAGPAFEGASISCGMRAEAGAIDSIQFDNGIINYTTIDNELPKGICGSGLISCISEMLRTGIIDRTGRFNNDKNPDIPLLKHIRIGKNKIREFVILAGSPDRPEIIVTQNDIRELQMAKAAIAAGIQILCNEAGITRHDIQKVFLAGAFGSYLDLNDLDKIGLLSTIEKEKIIPVGNAVALGGAICLASKSQLLKSDIIAAQIQPINLADKESFNAIWMDNMDFAS